MNLGFLLLFGFVCVIVLFCVFCGICGVHCIWYLDVFVILGGWIRVYWILAVLRILLYVRYFVCFGGTCLFLNCFVLYTLVLDVLGVIL